MMPGQPSGYGPNPVIMQQPGMDNPPMYPGPPQPYGQMPMQQMNMPMPMPAPYQPGPTAPMGGGWQQPNMISPQGLEYLIPLNQVFLVQKTEGWEVFTGFHFENRYAIVDGNGQPLYAVQESSDTCDRMCCGSRRNFTMSFYDRIGQEVIRVERPFSFFGDEAEVYSGSKRIGYIRRKIISCVPQFTVYDETNKKVLRISGPLCFCGCEHEFTVYSMGGDEIGEIKKTFSGFAREMFTNADNFGVSFPLDLNVHIKALLLAATILVDFGYFEQER